jgi:hypothetical protein
MPQTDLPMIDATRFHDDDEKYNCEILVEFVIVKYSSLLVQKFASMMRRTLRSLKNA